MEETRELFTRFNDYSKDYPVVAAGIGIWALGVGTYILKSIPLKVWAFAIKNFTTELTITSTSESYHLFLKWFEDNKFSHNSRTIKISNGSWGDDKAVKAMGYGNHYFIFNGTPIKLNLKEKESAGSNRERDQITMTVIGRSHAVYDSIFDSIKENDLDEDKVIVHEFGDGWVRASEQRVRNIDTVHLNTGVKEEIVKFIEDFKSREKFDIKHGISHETAIMLKGPAGTGKSTLLKVLAGHFNMPVYNLNASALHKIKNAFASLPENALVVIEDIDGEAALHSREINSERKGKKKTEASGSTVVEAFSFTSMSDVLNAIQGLHTSHGRILIATTNHFEKLDEALVRSGRFNLKIEIGYADNSVIHQFVDRFFPEETVPSNFNVKSNTPSSDIEKAVLENLDNFDNFIKEVSNE